MKILPPAAYRASLLPHAAPRWLLEIEFTSPVRHVLRVCDQALSVLGRDWLPLVESWGSIADALNTIDAGGRPATAEVTFSNSTPVLGRSRLSDLIRSRFNPGGYDWAFAKATLKLLLDPSHVLGDEIPIGVFYLEDPTEIGEDTLTIRMSDQSLVLENAMLLTKISRADLSSCDAAVIGKFVPRIFGTLVNVVAVPAAAGVTTTLNEDLDTSETTITLTDASSFPASGTVMIDQELIAYASKSGNDLTSCTRASNSTIAAAHDTGVTVFEARATYVFIVCENVAGHLAKSVSNIRVNGLPAQTSPAVNLNNTSLVAGKSYVTITFTPADLGLFHTIPAGRNQSIAVTAVTVTGDGATYVASATRTVVVSADSEASSRTTRKLAWNVSKATAWATSNAFTINRRLPNGTDVQIAYMFGNGTQTQFSGTDTQEVAGVGDEEIFMTSLHGSAQVATLTFNSYEVAYAGTGSRAASSTAAAVIGEVTCDVEGLQDDSSGSISGTANQLLENPTDITKFILRSLFPGVNASDLGSTWSVTRSRHAAGAYEWAIRFEEPVRFSELRRKLGEQARSLLFLEGGKWEFRYLDDLPVAQKTLNAPREFEAASTLRRTALPDVRNRIRVHAQLDHRTGDYRRVTTVQDLTQGVPRQAGATEDDAIPYDLELDFVQDATTADALGAFVLAEKKRQRFEFDATAFWNVLAVDKGDYEAIDDHPLLAGHGDTNLVWSVRGKRHLGDGRIALSMVEANH